MLISRYCIYMATRWVVMTCVVMARCSNASSDLDFFAQHSRRVNQQNHLLVGKNLGTQRYGDDDDNGVSEQTVEEKLLTEDHDGWQRHLNTLPYNVPADLRFLLKSINKKINMEEEHEELRGRRRQLQHRTQKRSVQQDQDEVEAACECVRARCPRREEFGPVIIHGECEYNSITKQREQRSAEAGYEVPLPLFTLEDDGGFRCAGDKPLILLSSGHRSRLSLSDVPEVLVCPGSLSPYLQHLTIDRVPQVKVGKGSLQPRQMGFTLSVTGSGAGGKLTLPEDGLKVDTGEVREYGSEMTGVLMEAEEEDVKPSVIAMEVKVEVRNVSEVYLEERSVVAPLVYILVEGVTQATFAGSAIMPYRNAELSFLKISSTDYITLGSKSAVVGLFTIQKVGKLHIHEGGIEIFSAAEEGLVDIREVSELVLEEGAITYPRGGSLYMQNVLVNHAGRRAVTTGTSHLPLPLLANVTLKHVVFENSHPIAFCLPASYASLTDLVMLRELGVEDEKAICVSAAGDLHTTTVRDVTGDSAVASAVVACTSRHPPLIICNDPHCLPCYPTSPTEAPTNAAVTSTGKIPETSPLVTTPHPLDDSTTSNTTTLIMREPPSTERTVLPPYAMALLLVSSVAILALFMYCVYKIHKKGKQGEYKMPRATPRHTFPSTIVTRDTLNTQPALSHPVCCPTPSHHPSQLHPHRPEMYVSFTTTPPPYHEDASSIQDSYGSERASVVSSNSYPSRNHVPLTTSETVTATPTSSPLLRTKDSSDDQTSSVGNSQDLPPYGYY